MTLLLKSFDDFDFKISTSCLVYLKKERQINIKLFKGTILVAGHLIGKEFEERWAHNDDFMDYTHIKIIKSESSNRDFNEKKDYLIKIKEKELIKIMRFNDSFEIKRENENITETN